MGLGFKGDTGHHHTIAENINSLKSNYGFNNGYFGEQGQSRHISTRNIKSDNPIKDSKDFYDKITHGGIENKLPNGKGYMTEMSDGSIITYREYKSSDGSPVVDINIKYSKDNGGIKQQKIHFVKRRSNYD